MVFVVTLKDGKSKEYRSGDAKTLVAELENRLIKDDLHLSQDLARVGKRDRVGWVGHG